MLTFSQIFNLKFQPPRQQVPGEPGHSVHGADPPVGERDRPFSHFHRLPPPHFCPAQEIDTLFIFLLNVVPVFIGNFHFLVDAFKSVKRCAVHNRSSRRQIFMRMCY